MEIILCGNIYVLDYLFLLMKACSYSLRWASALCCYIESTEHSKPCKPTHSQSVGMVGRWNVQIINLKRYDIQNCIVLGGS